jgi:hypothetical protein
MSRILILVVAATLLVACGKQDQQNEQQAETAHDSTSAESMAPEAEARYVAELIPRTVIFGNPDRSIARISPNGAYVSWLAPRDGVMNIWVAPADDPGSASVITNDTYRGIQFYRWAPNSQFVYYAQDDDGDENFHVYSANIETSEVNHRSRVLTTPESYRCGH